MHFVIQTIVNTLPEFGAVNKNSQHHHCRNQMSARISLGHKHNYFYQESSLETLTSYTSQELKNGSKRAKISLLETCDTQRRGISVLLLRTCSGFGSPIWDFLAKIFLCLTCFTQKHVQLLSSSTDYQLSKPSLISSFCQTQRKLPTASPKTSLL